MTEKPIPAWTLQEGKDYCGTRQRQKTVCHAEDCPLFMAGACDHEADPSQWILE